MHTHGFQKATWVCKPTATWVSNNENQQQLGYVETVSGIPFWNALGFEDSKKIDPDDQMPIYIKHIGQI